MSATPTTLCLLSPPIGFTRLIAKHNTGKELPVICFSLVVVIFPKLAWPMEFTDCQLHVINHFRKDFIHFYLLLLPVAGIATDTRGVYNLLWGGLAWHDMIFVWRERKSKFFYQPERFKIPVLLSGKKKLI